MKGQETYFFESLDSIYRIQSEQNTYYFHKVEYSPNDRLMHFTIKNGTNRVIGDLYYNPETVIDNRINMTASCFNSSTRTRFDAVVQFIDKLDVIWKNTKHPVERSFEGKLYKDASGHFEVEKSSSVESLFHVNYIQYSGLDITMYNITYNGMWVPTSATLKPYIWKRATKLAIKVYRELTGE